jgi:IS30 family transposase
MAKQLTIGEREILAQMNYAGESQAEIARELGRHRSTICRELKRNSAHYGYFAVQAQSCARVRRQVRWWGNKKMEQDTINQFVRRGLEQYWSPEQIAGRLRRHHSRCRKRQVSRQTIYNWIKRQQDRQHWESFLRRGGKRRRTRTVNEERAAASIANRPAVVDRRNRYGDWEGDTVVGCRHRGALVTNVERKSGYLLFDQVERRQANPVCRTLAKQFKSLPSRLRKTLTLDNGSEFSEHQRLSDQTGIAVYFARPYHSWERGTNEDTNGLLRQFFPKGTDFTEVDRREVTRAKKLINDRPRKRLGYKTPNEVFQKQIQRCD